MVIGAFVFRSETSCTDWRRPMLVLEFYKFNSQHVGTKFDISH